MDGLRADATSVPFSPTVRDTFHPEAFFNRKWLFKCKIRILIVTDSNSGGFDETSGFHLGQILNILDTDPWSHIEFDVTKAHRDNVNTPDVLDMFRFDTHDLGQYSQIWLFGIAPIGMNAFNPISKAELRALSEFMDAGGGVFATGDHEDLGRDLCAEVLRVRSMRRWYFPDPGPNGEPTAPIQTFNPGTPQHIQHNTLVSGGTQTDPVPQQIAPVLFTRTASSGIVRRVVQYPHPILCGRDGIIRYLPDHMHEGLVEVPDNLGQSWTFDGQSFEEYPTYNGHREKPVVIAQAGNITTNQSFGVLGAYDGHRSGVGRVVVDATWHHWFNINTLPYINASDPAHPTYTPATVEKWRQIKEYYRNVAVWLARPSLQNCIRNNGLLWVMADVDIAITVQNLDRVGSRPVYFWQLGKFAKDALGRFASQCQSLRWIVELLYEFEIPYRIDPWVLDQTKRGLRDVPNAIDLEEFETVALGAAFHAATLKFGQTDAPERLMADDGEALFDVMRDGVRLGVEACADHHRAGCEAGEGFLKSTLR